MDNLKAKDQFLQSLERCEEDESFIPSFYKRFLSTSDEIKDKFRHTDFEKQNKMLIRSLKLAAGATIGEPEALQELRDRAETHDRHHLNIKPELYDAWLNAVIETAREYDAQWNDNIESIWRSILGHVINHMIKFY